MKIEKFEEIINSKYKVEKITNFDELKAFLISPFEYEGDFTPSAVSEGDFENEEFYAVYVFDEREISKVLKAHHASSGWTTTIVFIASLDKKTISNYFVMTSNALPDDEYLTFLRWIDKLSGCPGPKY